MGCPAIDGGRIQIRHGEASTNAVPNAVGNAIRRLRRDEIFCRRSFVLNGLELHIGTLGRLLRLGPSARRADAHGRSRTKKWLKFETNHNEVQKRTNDPKRING